MTFFIAGTVPRVAKIALDIDSTLHHYWDLLERIALERYDVRLPYADQKDWGITELGRDELIAVVEETHSDENIEGAEPYEGAVEAVRRWHEEGHWIHITSHRRTSCAPATERWLDAVGIPYDDLHCSFDKITRCVELEIDVLVDDSPVNIARATQNGILAATIRHPWNNDAEADDRVIVEDDWPALAAAVDAALAARD